MTPVIKAEALCHIYSRGTPFEKTAIENVSLEIPHGEFVGLIGHTGSGKSTFIQHLNGLLKPTSGRVLYEGRDINETKERARDVRSKVGLVFQYPEYQLFEETVYRDIAFGPKNMKLSESEIKERVCEAAAFVGVGEELFERSPLELSGGQKRRIAVAGVIAMRPQVLILDEPTAGLDPAGRESMLQNMLNYRDQTGSTVILVTHNMEDAARISDRMIVFNEGKIAMDAAPSEVFSRGRELEEMGLDVPGSAKTARLLRERGVALTGNIYTAKQLRDELITLWKGGAPEC